MVRELMTSPDLARVLGDAYGNYVVQSILTITSGAMHQFVVDQIRPHVATLRWGNVEGSLEEEEEEPSIDRFASDECLVALCNSPSLARRGTPHGKRILQRIGMGKV